MTDDEIVLLLLLYITITDYFSNHDPLTEFGDFSCEMAKENGKKLSHMKFAFKCRYIKSTFTLNCLMVPSRAAALPEK